jgi:hypothetical protein
MCCRLGLFRRPQFSSPPYSEFHLGILYHLLNETAIPIYNIPIYNIPILQMKLLYLYTILYHLLNENTIPIYTMYLNTIYLYCKYTRARTFQNVLPSRTPGQLAANNPPDDDVTFV